MTVRLDIEPKPTPRPRVGKFGTYYPKKYQAYKESLEWLIKEKNIPKKDYLMIDITLACSYPKATAKCNLKENFPMRDKFDCDNGAKGLLDALENTGVIENDRQLFKVSITKIRTCGSGYIEFTLFE